MTDTIQQVKFNQYGPAEVLEMVEAAMPKVQAGEVLLKVKAIGVNYSDILRQKISTLCLLPCPLCRVQKQ